MNYDELEATFPGRRLTRIVNSTKASRLTFTQAVVYSCLVERAGHNKGASKKQISTATALHESSAVPRALLALQGHGLVELRGRYWWAVEPSEETLPWFRYQRGTENRKWCRRLSYWWAGRRKPKSPLTVTQTAVYFKLFNLMGRRITIRGLARLLRVDDKTVTSAIKKLKEVGLVDDDLYPNAPAADQIKWFKPRPANRAFKVTDLFPEIGTSDAESVVLSERPLNSAGVRLLDAGFSEAKVESYFSFVRAQAKNYSVILSFITRFDEFFRDIEAQHRANVAAGKYTRAKNCFGLLREETRKRLAELRKSRNGR